VIPLPQKKTKSEQEAIMTEPHRQFFTSLLSIQDLIDGEDEEAIKRIPVQITSNLVELVEDIKWDFLCIEELADHMIMNQFASIFTPEPKILFTDDEHYGDDEIEESETSTSTQYLTTQIEEKEEGEEGESEQVVFSWDWSKQKMMPTAKDPL